MEKIRVIVTGATGRVGREVVAAVAGQADMELVGGLSRAPSTSTLALPGGGTAPLASDLAALIATTRPAVLVDFTNAAATLGFARIALPRQVAMVIGTSGLGQADLDELRSLGEAHGVGVVVGPNFGIAGVLLMHVCKVLAPHFEYAEIVEMHREGKLDAPSGTAVATARAMLAARGGAPFQHNVAEKESVPHTRGGEVGGVAIHSVRSPGVVGVHEVLFGGAGESLTVRHDSLTRESFVPGVLLAVRAAVQRPEFVFGLESLLGLAK